MISVSVRFARGSSPGLKYVIGYTWDEFLCAKTVDAASYLPCDRSDPLVCHGKRQYGVHSYGYGTSASSRAAEVVECGDPTVQNRHMFVNRHVRWIADVVAGHGSDDGDRRRRTRPEPGPTTARADAGPSSAAAAAAAAATAPQTTAVGDASSFDPQDYPYLVYLEGDTDEPVCGGTLISPLLVLTSAYCTTRMSTIEVL